VLPIWVLPYTVPSSLRHDARAKEALLRYALRKVGNKGRHLPPNQTLGS
jgi:hypothetical protein